MRAHSRDDPRGLLVFDALYLMCAFAFVFQRGYRRGRIRTQAEIDAAMADDFDR